MPPPTFIAAQTNNVLRPAEQDATKELLKPAPRNDAADDVCASSRRPMPGPAIQAAHEERRALSNANVTGNHLQNTVLTPESVKVQVQELADELNTALGSPLIAVHQQAISTKNICLKTPKFGTLYIKPARDRYLLALGGNSLAARMEPFMEQLTGEPRHGFVQTKPPREPYWYIENYESVRIAAYFYAELPLPHRQNSD